MTRVLVLHGYSADNAGDGLLVRETLSLVREALGDVEITLLASRPETFAELQIKTVRTVPSARGWDRELRATLKQADDFDIIVAVGGGYLRAGTVSEAVKTALVHGPQLRAAARTSTPTLYLPQSIGPARFGTRRLLRRTLGKIDRVFARDDRTVLEVGGPTMRRMPDLATAAVIEGRIPGRTPDETPVLSIRAVHGRVNPQIYQLAGLLGTYDGYIQSTTGGNDDRPAAATLTARRMIDRAELMAPSATPRVVVAVRLHAALMALAAGHYVIHLAYERKGFGAFDDMQILPWVHNVNQFDPHLVQQQAQALLHDSAVRADYDSRIVSAAAHVADARSEITLELRRLIGEK